MKSWYKISQIKFPLTPEDKIRLINSNPDNYSEEDMRATYQEFSPEWYMRNNIGKGTKAQYLDLAQRYVERWSKDEEDNFSRKILGQNEYQWGQISDILLERDLERATFALRETKTICDKSCVIDIIFEEEGMPPKIVIEYPNNELRKMNNE
tara:strand:+ start:1203 stop:1658 length:456 start_codon:yes stop_codon:yes gene_type:complete